MANSKRKATKPKIRRPENLKTLASSMCKATKSKRVVLGSATTGRISREDAREAILAVMNSNAAEARPSSR